MIRTAVIALTLAATPALAQAPPAGTPDPAADAQAQQLRAQAVAQARAAQAARARAFAEMAPTTPTGPTDPGRARPVGGNVLADMPTPQAPSPYGDYYRIRTPWDPR